MALKDLNPGDPFGEYVVGSVEYRKVNGKLHVYTAAVLHQILDYQDDLTEQLQAKKDKRAFINAQIDQLQALKTIYQGL
jgi:hypothetical protein